MRYFNHIYSVILCIFCFCREGFEVQCIIFDMEGFTLFILAFSFKG